jgi:hypothetical protein
MTVWRCLAKLPAHNGFRRETAAQCPPYVRPTASKWLWRALLTALSIRPDSTTRPDAVDRPRSVVDGGRGAVILIAMISSVMGLLAGLLGGFALVKRAERWCPGCGALVSVEHCTHRATGRQAVAAGSVGATPTGGGTGRAR